MRVISEDKINEIRNSADIVSIISDYIPLKMQGRNYFGICPFHDDHTPSMSVSKERQLFKCFVCNKGGNVFTFVKDYENISYIEAVKKVADRIGIPLQIEGLKKENTKFKLEYEIMEYATKIFQNNLSSKEGIKAKEYLEKRGITEKIIKDFKIGLAIKNNNYLYEVLTKKNYDVNLLDELGLITKDGLSGYDKFQNRIMIPITDLDGHIVGYTGRIFNNEDSAKYINTKETKIYKKGNIIFNYYNAKNYIKSEKSVILVEGNMDAIRVSSSGINNVLALMGTSITKEQISILKNLRVPVILMLDNDNAGALATMNVGNELEKENVVVKVVRLTGAKDPDEYILKYGVDKFKDTINNSINYFDFKLQYLKENKNLNNTEELVNYIKSVLKLLDKEDNLTKEITLKKLSNEYDIDYETLKKEVQFKEEKKEIPKEIFKIKKPQNKYDECVEVILYYMMSDSKYMKIFNKQLGFLKNSIERELVTEIEYYIEKHHKINLADFLTYIEEYDNLREFVNNICGRVNIDTLDENDFLNYLKVIDNILKNDNMQEVRAKIVHTTNEEEQFNNLKKQIEIKKKIINIKEV